MPGNINLLDLHGVLQVVMGWTNKHLHSFLTATETYCLPSDDPDPYDMDERQYTLEDIVFIEKESFLYEYDFGDGWSHEILVEALLPFMGETQALCIGGKNACPPEDCGGISGYYEFLKIISTPNHVDHRRMLEWSGVPFDPKHFDIEKINAKLRVATL